MNILFDDEKSRLSDEIIGLMKRAADDAISYEFGGELKALGLDASDIDAEIALSVVADDEIQDLNRDYRGMDKVTDVLSFPQFESRDELLADLVRDDEGPASLIGDVVICYDQAERQAEEYGTGMKRELLYLFVHSIIHLFGYDHEDEEERRDMRAREEAVLSKLKEI